MLIILPIKGTSPFFFWWFLLNLVLMKCVGQRWLHVAMAVGFGGVRAGRKIQSVTRAESIVCENFKRAFKMGITI